MAAASEIRAEAQSTREQNELLEIKVDQAQGATSRSSPQYRAELAGDPAADPDGRHALGLPAAAGRDRGRALGDADGGHAVGRRRRSCSRSPAVDRAGAGADRGVAVGVGRGGGRHPAGPAPVPTARPGSPRSRSRITALGTYDNTLGVPQRPAELHPAAVPGHRAHRDVAGPGGRRQAASPATTAGDQELVITGYTYVAAGRVSPSRRRSTRLRHRRRCRAPIPGKNPLVAGRRSLTDVCTTVHPPGARPGGGPASWEDPLHAALVDLR